MAKSKKVEEVDVTAPTVQETPEQSFDERTAQGQPWRNEDGSENRGDVVESEPAIEGADADEEPVEPAEEPVDEEAPVEG